VPKNARARQHFVVRNFFVLLICVDSRMLGVLTAS